MIEAIVLGVLIGVALGMGTSLAIAELAGWRIVISPQAVGLAVAFAFVIGVFFGWAISVTVRDAGVDVTEDTELRFGPNAGTGLGLCQARQAINLAGGNIFVDRPSQQVGLQQSQQNIGEDERER